MNKYVLKSKTVVGILVIIAPTLATLFGFTLTADNSAMISNSADSIIQLLGAALGIYGRVKAKGGIYV